MVQWPLQYGGEIIRSFECKLRVKLTTFQQTQIMMVLVVSEMQSWEYDSKHMSVRGAHAILAVGYHTQIRTTMTIPGSIVFNVVNSE